MEKDQAYHTNLQKDDHYSTYFSKEDDPSETEAKKREMIFSLDQNGKMVNEFISKNREDEQTSRNSIIHNKSHKKSKDIDTQYH